jgi:hypothetical protein
MTACSLTESILLPVKYVHLVFTLPAFLNDFVLLNHGVIYNILFDASWHAVNKCADSFLGVQTGALSVLHTWGQNLSLHSSTGSLTVHTFTC